jgi:hypothetical protein
MNKIINFNNATLFVALSLSVIAEYYAIIGLATIFAGAAVSAMVMGAILGIAKITALVWLRKYWKIATRSLKLYLVTAVIILATLTSTGIFGYLSKAHSSSSLPGGEMQSQVQLIEDKITNEKEIIKSAKDALAQLDSQVNNFIAKGESERSAERSVQIRRQQQGERKQLQKEIETANTNIAKLVEEKTPIVRELRNFEAEIGPIKYIAALIYGDNPDQDVLEKSVRWMIILLVIVFDPLAIALVLAANHSKQYEKDNMLQTVAIVEPVITKPVESEVEKVVEPNLDVINQELKDAEVKTETYLVIEPEPSEPNLDVINQELKDAEVKRPSYSVFEPEVEKVVEPKTFKHNDYIINHPFIRVYSLDWTQPEAEVVQIIEPVIEQVNEADKHVKPKLSYADLGGSYVQFEGKRMHKRVLQSMHPELFIKEDKGPIEISFGTSFPINVKQGSIYTRVDMLPHKVYKFTGTKWVQIDKNTTTSYLSDEYLKFLTDKIQTGEHDLEALSDVEREFVRDYLLASLPINTDKTV